MKIWFVPVIIIGIVIGILSTTYTPKFTSISPPVNKNMTIEKKIINKAHELKLAPKPNIIMNGAIGAVIGWVVSRVLDFGFVIIRRKLKKGKLSIFDKE